MNNARSGLEECMTQCVRRVDFGIVSRLSDGVRVAECTSVVDVSLHRAGSWFKTSLATLSHDFSKW